MPRPPYRPPVAAYLDVLRDWATRHERSPAGVVADLAALLGRAEGWPVGAWAGLPSEPGPTSPPIPPAEVASPELLGQAYEAMLASADRRRCGAYFTPVAVARRLVDIALDRRSLATRTDVVVGDGSRRPGEGSVTALVGDPSVGGGVFLLAAARWLADRTTCTERGASSAARIASDALWGADVDPTAVAVTRLALAWWAWRHDSARSWPREAGRRVVVGDALLDDSVWPSAIPIGHTSGGMVSAVVGNPPFLGQLKRPTARRPEAAAQLVTRYGPAARGYVDTAALFLLAVCRYVPAGTRVVLILPESALVAAHAGHVRAEVLERSSLVGLWLGGSGIFSAGVRVCAPVLEVGGPHRSSSPDATEIWTGAGVERSAPVRVNATDLAEGPTWGPVSAHHRGIPSCRPLTNGTVSDLATATAGFRDQFYGLAPHVSEDDAAIPCKAPLITSGVIGPARCAWGLRPVRFAGRAWRAPVVDLDALQRDTPVLARWVEARLRPKLLVATQSAVVEAMADPAGQWIPSVPVISLEPRLAGDLWRLLAVLVSPVASAWALERYGGAGLSASAVKLSARQLLEVPLPLNAEMWDSAAATCRSACGRVDERLWRDDLLAAAHLMNEAYGLETTTSDGLLAWWMARLPRATSSRP
jgi:hypothetical protein